jgi:hypothetical protein
VVASKWLQSHREEVVNAWLSKVAATYPSHMAKFLLSERDQFRNPAGFALKQNLPKLFDDILEGADPKALRIHLDPVVRLRAVQEFAPSEAVGFVFFLKEAVREACPGWNEDESVVAFLNRIDGAALEAFNSYSECREKIFSIKVDESKRKLFILEKIYGTLEASASSDREFKAGARGDMPREE